MKRKRKYDYCDSKTNSLKYVPSNSFFFFFNETIFFLLFHIPRSMLILIPLFLRQPYSPFRIDTNQIRYNSCLSTTTPFNMITPNSLFSKNNGLPYLPNLRAQLYVAILPIPFSELSTTYMPINLTIFTIYSDHKYCLLQI